MSKPPVCTQKTFVPMSFAIAPATACSARPKPLFGYATLGLYCPTAATRSSVAMAACTLVLTKPTCGRSTGTCDAMLTAALRSSAASFPVFGLLNA